MPTPPIDVREVYGDDQLDSYGRVRTSTPNPVASLQLLADKDPDFWDEEITDTSGLVTAIHQNSSVEIHVETDDKVIRQTKTYWNYASVKNLQLRMGALIGPGGSGVSIRLGSFTDTEGMLFFLDETTLKVAIRRGGIFTEIVAQDEWNLDRLDGSGIPGGNPSGITLDRDRIQIFVIDYEWYCAGRVRFGFLFGGQIVYCHQFNHEQTLILPYTLSPNHPVRFEASTTDESANFIQYSSEVAEEGGNLGLAILEGASTDGTALSAMVSGTIYALIGIRLQAAALDTMARPHSFSLLSQSQSDFQWMLLINPTIAGTFTFADEPSTRLQSAFGTSSNTIVQDAWDKRIGSGEIAAIVTGGSVAGIAEDTLALGSTIGEVPDEFILAVRPLSTNATIQGSFWFSVLR